jgi:hypothetical protein
MGAISAASGIPKVEKFTSSEPWDYPAASGIPKVEKFASSGLWDYLAASGVAVHHQSSC